MKVGGYDLSQPVSRETKAMLDIYADMIIKWNSSINLISKSTVQTLYQRHILDSLQILRPDNIPAGLWVDLGSGGGLPGLVVAIDAKARQIDRPVVLIESDQRKAVFLREAIRTLSLRASVIISRIQDSPPLSASVVSSRALAPLVDLCDHAFHHLAVGGMAIFHKGESRAEEIAGARERWSFELTETASLTNENAAILYLKEIRHG